MKTITVISAIILDYDTILSIEKSFSAKHQEAVQFTYEIDSNLLGGIMVIDGDNYYDGSVKSQLNKIQKIL